MKNFPTNSVSMTEGDHYICCVDGDSKGNLPNKNTLFLLYLNNCGPGSSVGIATELRAGRSGIESRWGRNFPPVQNGPGAHPATCTMGTGSFPGGRDRRGLGLTPHPYLEYRGPRKSTAIPLLTLRAFVAYKKGENYLFE